GLVKSVGADADAHLTLAGSVTGTPLYLSPEAIQHHEDLDPRADLYAVGAVAYFLLTGTPVFEAKSVVDLLMHHVNATPQPPSERLGRFIATDVEAIILRCLAKRRDDRFATARELANALGTCCNNGDWTEVEAAAWWAAKSPNVSLMQSASATKPGAGGETALWANRPH
ncbi:MAG: protein kinase domain-containing protein, partial [Stellaceae bacterium]